MANDRPAPSGPTHPRSVRLGHGANAWVEGTGEPLLLLHGWGLRPHVFRPAMRQLAGRGFHVAAPTLAVVGRTWDMDRAVHRAMQTLEHLEWGSATVVGYSLGGAVATSLAADHPDKVRTLVLVNSIGLAVDRGPLGWALPVTRYARTANLSALAAFGRNAVQVRGLTNLAGAARYARAAALETELSQIKTNKTRSLVMWGADDRLLPIEMGRRIAAALDAPLHVVGKADHDWTVRDPAMFARELDLALRSHDETPKARFRRLGFRPVRAARSDRP